MIGSKRHKQPVWYVLGASGFIGSYIYHLLRQQTIEVIGTSYPDTPSGLHSLDITNHRQVQNFFKAITPVDIVIHAAAQPNVELCQAQPDIGYQVNVIGTKNVVTALRPVTPRYIFFSTEYIFDGTQGPYSENDQPHPLNAYGQQKLEAEHYIQQHLPQALIIRTTTVFGYEAAAKNFFMSCVKRLYAEQTMAVPIDQISTPTYVEDLATVVVAIAPRNEIFGPLHMVGPERMSRFDLALRIAKQFDLTSKHLQPVSTSELKQLAPRPLQAGLTIDRLQSLGYTIRDTDAALAEINTEYGSLIRPH